MDQQNKIPTAEIQKFLYILPTSRKNQYCYISPNPRKSTSKTHPQLCILVTFQKEGRADISVCQHQFIFSPLFCTCIYRFLYKGYIKNAKHSEDIFLNKLIQR